MECRVSVSPAASTMRLPGAACQGDDRLPTFLASQLLTRPAQQETNPRTPPPAWLRPSPWNRR